MASSMHRWTLFFELLDDANQTEDGRWLPDLRDAARRLAARDFPDPPHWTDGESYADCAPALQSATTRVLLDLRAALHQNALSVVTPWVEKLMRVCEVRQTTLRKRLLTDVEDVVSLQRKVQILRVLFLEFFFHTNDARYLNIVLKISDQPWVLSLKIAPDNRSRRKYGDQVVWLTLAAEILLEHALHVVRQAQWKQPIGANETGICGTIHGDSVGADKLTGSVVVFSPSRFSLYTLLVTSLLRQRGIPVCGVVIRKLVNPQRVVQEFSRDGMRLLRKIWNKLVLKKRAYRPLPFATLPDRLKQLGVTSGRVDAFAAKHGIEVVSCRTLNDSVVQRYLQERTPRLAVFTGGGIIREETLRSAGDGVLNCHMGRLPFYRGMDVVEWPIFQGHVDQLGFTVHFMDHGIDTGNILGMFPVSQEDAENIETLRLKYEVPMAESLVEMVVRWLSGEIQFMPQAADAGRQHFIMHPTLRAIAEQRYQVLLPSGTR